MRTAFIRSIILFAVIGLAVFAADAQTVSGTLTGPVTKGASARGAVTIMIPGGLHVNSSKPSSEYAIPTSIRLTAPGLKVKDIRYPRGKNKKFQFSEDSINIYEGRVVIPFRVDVPDSYRGQTISVRAVVRYQACTDEVCYPPRTKNLTMTARVR